MRFRYPFFLAAFLAAVALAAAPHAQIALPVTFEEAIDYELNDFGGNTSSIVADPTDATNKVVESIRGAGAEFFAGTTVANTNGFTAPIPFADGMTTMSVRVWSPMAGVPVRFKVEDHTDAGVSVESEVLTTAAGMWETLVFDFVGNKVPGTADINFASSYTKASIFFNFNQSGTTEPTTYYWDDVAFGGDAGGGGGGGGIALPIGFEDDIDYELNDFGGNTSSIVADPTDATNKVVESIRGAGAEFFAGTTVANTNGFTAPIPFADGMTTMSVRVWSPAAGVPVRFKVEDHTDAGVSVESEVLTTAAGMWETLVFDFVGNKVPGTADINFASSYTKASIFFNFNQSGTTDPTTYYWDDVAFGGDAGGGGGGGGIALPIGFEDDIDYELNDFGGNTSSIVADPTDATNKVVESIRGAGAEFFAGTTVANTNGFTAPIPFADGMTTMSVRVWSPAAGVPVRFKVEDHTDAGVSVESEVLTTAAGMWETLVFDFVGNKVPGTADINFASSYTKASIFFNFNQSGTTDPTTYYWDDVAFGSGDGGGGGGNAIALPVTFEEMIDYEIRDFNGATTTVVEDPTDATNTVAQTVRAPDAATFAGTVLADVSGLAEPVPFTADVTTMSLRVWSPTADTPVRLKLENLADAGINVEKEVRTTVGGEWATLVFDFSSPEGAALNLDADYNKVVVFFDFGRESTPAAVTYYWDDLSFGGDPPPANDIALPVTFEEDIDYELNDFGGNTSTIIEDPTDASNTVVQSIRGAGAATFAGTTVADRSGFTAPIPFAAGDTQMRVTVWTPEAGTPVRLKVEDHTDPTVSVEAQVNTQTGGAWETLVFDFANEADGTAAINFASSYTKASIFFDFGVEGATEATTFYWDDLAFGGIPVAAEDDADGDGPFVRAPRVAPNPSAGPAAVVFELRAATDLQVDVVDLLGRRVAILAAGPQAAGEVRLDVPTGDLPAGVYVVRVRTDAEAVTTRLTVVR